MALARLCVYTVAHAVDSVDEHIARLESIDAEPDIVALELPDSDTPKKSANAGVRETIKQSPATGLAWYLVTKENRKRYQSTDGTAGRSDAEYEAGRRYAEQIDVPAIPVDLTRAESAARYATWPRRIRDTVLLLLGVSVPICLTAFTALFLLGGLGLIVQTGLSSNSIGALLIGLFCFGLLYRRGLKAPFQAAGTVGKWYLEGIREIRDRGMYERIREACLSHDAESVLLVVGANHYSGLKSHAESDGIDCFDVESPAVARYDGNIEEITASEFSELVKASEE